MLDKKIPERLKLKDKSSTMIKVMKLYDLAEELGIAIEFFGHAVVVSDRDRDSKLPYLYMEDIEEGHYIDQFPPSTEFKLVYDNPEYLKQRRLENVAYQAERNKKEEAAKTLKLAEEAKEKEERRLANIEREKKLLAELKAKYEDNK